MRATQITSDLSEKEGKDQEPGEARRSQEEP
jgi:hypothetical protein